MIPKILSAFISAAILSAVAGTLPCEATQKPRTRPKATSPASASATGAANLNAPAMDFSGAKPVLDNGHRDLVPPSRDKNQFFDQTLR